MPSGPTNATCEVMAGAGSAGLIHHDAGTGAIHAGPGMHEHLRRRKVFFARCFATDDGHTGNQ